MGNNSPLDCLKLTGPIEIPEWEKIFNNPIKIPSLEDNIPEKVTTKQLKIALDKYAKAHKKGKMISLQAPSTKRNTRETNCTNWPRRFSRTKDSTPSRKNILMLLSMTFRNQIRTILTYGRKCQTRI